MDKINLHPDNRTRKYATALKSYLHKGDEAALQRAYEFGRRCLADGESILDMVSIHHQAMRVALNGAAPPQFRPDTQRKAGEFFTECMSPFEMTHRAFGEANQALRRLNETLEEQARLIGRELHDQAGQLLAAVHIEVDETARELPEANRGRLQKIKGLLDQVETQLRDLSHELRPTVLDDLGLVAALESLAHRVAKRTGLAIAIYPFSGERVPGRVEVALYRIAEEALTNVIKHAKATSVTIRLRRAEKVFGCTIRDNGRGFNSHSARPRGSQGLGLMGIQERVQALGGEVRVESGPGKGTRLKIMIPLEG